MIDFVGIKQYFSIVHSAAGLLKEKQKKRPGHSDFAVRTGRVTDQTQVLLL